jgi:hypothetical protein
LTYFEPIFLFRRTPANDRRGWEKKKDEGRKWRRIGANPPV